MTTGPEQTTELAAATEPPPSYDRAAPGAAHRAAGAIRGLVDVGSPSLVFVLVYRLFGSDLPVAAVAALGMAGILMAVRVTRGQRMRFAALGPVGVVVAAGAAWATGRPEDYFAPGILWGAALALTLPVSMLARRPLVGVVLGVATSGRRWSQRFSDPAVLRADMWATGIWFAALVLRLAAEIHFYLAGDLAWLAVLKFAGGCPLFGATLALTYALERRARSRLTDRPT